MDGQNRNGVENNSDAYTAPAEQKDGNSYQFHSLLASSQPPAGEEKAKRHGSISVRIAVIVLIVVALALAVTRLMKHYSISFDRGGGRLRISISSNVSAPEGPADGTPYDASYPWSYSWGTVPAGTAAGVDLNSHEWDGSSLTLSAKSEEQKLEAGDIYEKLSKSVAVVKTMDANGIIYTGMGVVMTEDGYVITNAHLLFTAETIEVDIDGKSYKGTVVGVDNATDLAVIRADVKDATPAEFGISDNSRAGDHVYIIGNPIGNSVNIIDCIISSIDDRFTYIGLNLSIMQLYASLGMNATGSAVVNEYGQVIGVIDTLFLWSYPEATGMSFALPMKEVSPVVNELLEYGYIKGRPTSGITASDIPAAAAAYYGYPDGVYITDINERSTAYAAGVRRGDLIMEANGIAIKTTNDLYMLINSMKIGDELSLYLYRSKDTGYVSFNLMDASILN